MSPEFFICFYCRKHLTGKDCDPGEQVDGHEACFKAFREESRQGGLGI